MTLLGVKYVKHLQKLEDQWHMYTQEPSDGRLWLRKVENGFTVGSTVTLAKLQFMRIKQDCMGNNYTRVYPKYSGLVPPYIQQLW
jgi:hypothetical protein